MNYQDHATNITRRLVDMIQTGSHGQWAMPWHTHDLGDLLNARNAATHSRYQGANVITLAIEALDRGYPTTNGPPTNNGPTTAPQVRKGERSAQVIKWVIRKTQADDQPAAGDSREVRQLLPRVYAVFKAHQVDGYENQPDTAPATPAIEWFASIGADVHYGSDRAYYDPRTDRIYAPAAEQFDDLEAFHATNLHEHLHWTAQGAIHVSSVHRRTTPSGEVRWDVRYRANDDTHRRKTYKRKVDAQRFANTVEADLARHDWVDPQGGRQPFSEWTERWISTTTHLKPKTRGTTSRSFGITSCPSSLTGPSDQSTTQKF